MTITSSGDTASGSADQTPTQKAYADIAPGLANLSDRVLFGEVWERPGGCQSAVIKQNRKQNL